MNRVKMGARIGAAFGLVYVLVNTIGLPQPAAVILRALGIAAFVGVIILARRTALPADAGAARAGFGRGYWLVVAAEVVAGVAGAVVLLRVLKQPHALVAWISLVVGVHFFGLSVVWRAPFYRWLGAAITLCGVAGLVAAASSSSRVTIATIAGVGPGLLLLGAAYWGLVRARAEPEVPSQLLT
ncbi:MAG: hypothetical protein M3042_02840 [Actinomycetota bacterium]|nr:hypothetical protein [Actinomycetota bacterium]